MFLPDRAWIDTFTEVLHDTMRRCGCTVNCCVEAACAGMGVTQAWGCLAEPVPVSVQVEVGNQATILPGPDGQSERREGFAGHLVMYFPTAEILSDPTADQFHDPQRGLHVPWPMTIPVPRANLAAGIAVTLPTGTTVAYQEMTGDVSWRALPAWYEPSTLTTRIAIRNLQNALPAPARRRRTVTTGGCRPGNSRTRTRR